MLLAGVGLTLAACASAPPPPPLVITYEQKIGWILRLEDQRILRDPQPVSAPVQLTRRVRVAPAPPTADLVRLAADPEARVRRRAALAIGRVGLTEGVPVLVGVLTDAEPEVRQMAAFGLGLIADRSAVEPLRAALLDPSPLVQGRAAEALSLIGDDAGGALISEMVASLVRSGEVARVAPDDVSYPLEPRVEAFRLGVYSLARLGAFDPLAAAVLDANGQPLVRWWPVAYALQRTQDKRSRAALVTFVRAGGSHGVVFAVRGLGALKDVSALDVLLPLVDPRRGDTRVAVAAIRALAGIGDPKAIPPLMQLVGQPRLDPNVRVEVVAALGALRAVPATDIVMDLLSDPWPSMRTAALRALSKISAETFVAVISGLEPDEDWSVRAALAGVLGILNRDAALARLRVMLKDTDLRVLPSVLSALVALHEPGIDEALKGHLKSSDVVVRMAAANLLGELQPPGGAAALVDSYKAGAGDTTYLARAAALDALAKYGAAAATETLKAALADKDWPVRVRAAQLLTVFDPAGDYNMTIRPAPSTRPQSAYVRPTLVAPTVSPHAYIETSRGTIEVELAVLDAPLTVDNFVTLVRNGFYDGLRIHRVIPDFVVQDGDPRSDGEGGPGFTIRDELNQLPYLRGTVGMALDWKDTGGSQFFITHSPQPYLDASHTVFGRVVAGMEVVDQIRQWDTIERIRIWDGTGMAGQDAR